MKYLLILALFLTSCVRTNNEATLDDSTYINSPLSTATVEIEYKGHLYIQGYEYIIHAAHCPCKQIK